MTDQNYAEMTTEEWTQLGFDIINDVRYPEKRDALHEDIPDLSVRLLKRVYNDQIEAMHEAYAQYKRIEDATNVIKDAIRRTTGEEALRG